MISEDRKCEKYVWWMLLKSHSQLALTVMRRWNSLVIFFSIQSVTWLNVTSRSPSLGNAFKWRSGCSTKPHQILSLGGCGTLMANRPAKRSTTTVKARSVSLTFSMARPDNFHVSQLLERFGFGDLFHIAHQLLLASLRSRRAGLVEFVGFVAFVHVMLAFAVTVQRPGPQTRAWKNDHRGCRYWRCCGCPSPHHFLDHVLNPEKNNPHTWRGRVSRRHAINQSINQVICRSSVNQSVNQSMIRRSAFYLVIIALLQLHQVELRL